MSHGNARLTVPRPAADRPAAALGLAAGAHRCRDGYLPQVRQDLDRPVRGRGRDRVSSIGPVRPHTTPTRTASRGRGPHRRATRASSAEDRLDRRRARPAGPHGVPGPAPPPGCRRPGRAGPDDRGGDPGLEESPRSATNATGPASWSTWTSRSSAGSPTAAAGGRRAAPPANHRRPHDAPSSATTTSTRWSMTTPGWPTPRSSPTRRAPPARRSSSAPRPTSPPTASPRSSGS